MKRDQVIEIILQRCGQRQDDVVLQAACVSEMALVQETILEQADFKPWFLLSEYHHTIVNTTDTRLPLPPNFLEEHDEGTVWVRDLTQSPVWFKVSKDDQDHLEEKYGDAPGMPKEYSIVGNYINLFPLPDKHYNIRMRFYERQPQLLTPYKTEQAVEENAWLRHAADWIMSETGAIVAEQYAKDKATGDAFRLQATEARKRVYSQTIAREEANRSRSMGDD